MNTRRFACAAALVCLGVFGATHRARATTFVAMSDADLAAHSVAVVTARVRAIEAASDAAGSIYTYVWLTPREVIAGRLPAGDVVLRELGGQLPGRREWVFGSPEYRVGEDVLVFVSAARDGTLRTTAMALGKYRLDADRYGRLMAHRGRARHAAVLDPTTGRLSESLPERQVPVAQIAAIARTVRPRAEGLSRLRAIPLELDGATERAPSAAFTLLGRPSRWFEPDDGLPVSYFLDHFGDEQLGLAVSRAAINSALAAWSAVPTASILLADAGLTEPAPFGGCPDDNRIVFNDPFDEVTDPTNCMGVLAVGGFCTSDETRTVHDKTFKRIITGKVTFNDGWTGCALWTPCNVAQVATHEIGHTIGFGHSADDDAIMAPRARFDGRCASLSADDINAANFVYPLVDPPSPTPSFTPRLTPTRTPTRATPTRTRTGTRTRTRAPTRRGAATSTASPSATATATPVPPTSTPSPTATVPLSWPPSGDWLQALLAALQLIDR